MLQGSGLLVYLNKTSKAIRLDAFVEILSAPYQISSYTLFIVNIDSSILNNLVVMHSLMRLIGVFLLSDIG